MSESLYALIKCKCCGKRRQKRHVGVSGDENFSISDVIKKQYTDICSKCKMLTVWEVVAYLGADKKKK